VARIVPDHAGSCSQDELGEVELLNTRIVSVFTKYLRLFSTYPTGSDFFGVSFIHTELACKFECPKLFLRSLDGTMAFMNNFLSIIFSSTECPDVNMLLSLLPGQACGSWSTSTRALEAFQIFIVS
jgi:hypothetical protein